MKKIIILVLAIAMVSILYGYGEASGSSSSVSQESSSQSSVDVKDETGKTNQVLPGVLTVAFDFTRGNTRASSQYAVWIENETGKLVKTLFVTNFVSSGGFKKREDALPIWVSKANPGEMSAKAVDAISGATPDSGSVSYVWDGTDETGKLVENGTYAVVIEGTLYWTSGVIFRGDFKVGGEKEDIKMVATFSEESKDNRNMIDAVSVVYEGTTNK